MLKVPTPWAIGQTVAIGFPKGVLFSQETAIIVVQMDKFKQISRTEERQTIWLTFLKFQWQEAQSNKEIINQIAT
jgi:hypothetical protein